ncbi:MAG TPA: hypothetical protein VGL19_18895, partial [Polyangiaceae bacterium]
MAKRMFGRLSPWSVLAWCAAATVLPARAHAESSASQKAAAESLFDEGVKAMKAGHFADACPKLEESERIDPGIGTLLYLGECYEKTGRSASAWATFREAASTAQAQGEADRARIASARADCLQAGLSQLAVRVAPETAQLGSLRVTRDNVAIATTLFGVAIPVDPGKYHIVASADGYERYEADIEVGANAESKSLDIPALKPAPKGSPAALPATTASAVGNSASTPTAGAPLPAPDATAQTSSATPLRTAAFITGAVGVVGLGIGSYFGVRAISKNSEAENHCPKGSQCDDAEGPRLTSQAKNAAVVSNIAIGVGA